MCVNYRESVHLMVVIPRFDLALEVRTLIYQCLSGLHKLAYFLIEYFFNYMSFI